VKVTRRVLTTSEKSEVLEYTATMVDAPPATDDYVSRKRSLSSGNDDHAEKKHCPESSVVVQSKQQQQPCSTNIKSSTAPSVRSAVSYTVSVCVSACMLCVCVCMNE